MAGRFKDEPYCDAAKFFFGVNSAYPSAMRTGYLWLGSSSHAQNYNLGVKRC
jgi:hypothetical protein